MLSALVSLAVMSSIASVDRPPTSGANSFYFPNRAPLRQTPLVKLPITSFKPGGWVKKTLELQRDGLAGNLSEISVWLTKDGNAWLNPNGTGKYGWEEMPYWLKGYCRIGFMLDDTKMMAETKVWVDGALSSGRADGDFGPIRFHRPGKRDLWPQMLMLNVLQSWHEKTGDERVLPFMKNYFKWQLTIADQDFLKDYWENSRGGDNLASVYWLYNRTGEPFLLELATKIDRNTANWRMENGLPNWHNVNVAQGFRVPAQYSVQSGKESDVQASYRGFDWIRTKWGQVPGGMFASDENAREGYDDPHQATETCGFVEQLGSNAILTSITGDPKWVANSEDVAFNSLPAAFLDDYRALRYLTAPNMVVSDAADHSPGIQNGGPFLLMNPFSSRCCQHNHTSAWPNFIEGTWMATQDDGLAALTMVEGAVSAKVKGGALATITTTTKYPFDGKVKMSVKLDKPSAFPLYILIPKWARGAKITSHGETKTVIEGKYAMIEGDWKSGDNVVIELPMTPRIRTWTKMQNSVSVDMGALTFSLLIKENFKKVDGIKNAQWDAGWREGVDQSKWPTYEILPLSAWNFGVETSVPFTIKRRTWPKNDMPFTMAGYPIAIEATGRRIPGWTIDRHGLVGELPRSPIKTSEPREKITLIPMGAAKLRISSFPTVK